MKNLITICTIMAVIIFSCKNPEQFSYESKAWEQRKNEIYGISEIIDSTQKNLTGFKNAIFLKQEYEEDLKKDLIKMKDFLQNRKTSSYSDSFTTSDGKVIREFSFNSKDTICICEFKMKIKNNKEDVFSCKVMKKNSKIYLLSFSDGKSDNLIIKYFINSYLKEKKFL